MTPTAVSLHLSTFLTLTAAKQQPKLTHACTTPGAQHCNCRCLSLMSVIAVGNQIDCTHRPSKYLYSHIQQTSARVPKCFQSTERGNRSDVMNISYYNTGASVCFSVQTIMRAFVRLGASDSTRALLGVAGRSSSLSLAVCGRPAKIRSLLRCHALVWAAILSAHAPRSDCDDLYHGERFLSDFLSAHALRCNCDDLYHCERCV